MNAPALNRLVLVPQPPRTATAATDPKVLAPAKPVRRYRLARVAEGDDRFAHLRRVYD